MTPPLTDAELLEILTNPLFGGVTIQRFEDVTFFRVHVHPSNLSTKDMLNDRGIHFIGAFVDVEAEAQIPSAIVLGWKKLRLMWHYGETGAWNSYGLFFSAPVPDDLKDISLDDGVKL